MKKLTQISAITLLGLSIGLAGCDSMTKSQMAGTGLGAAGGALIGYGLGGGTGAAVGAGLGGLTGYGVTKYTGH